GASPEKITFRYADQTFQTGDKKEFDCEAFFWNNDSLYLFTKSWEKGIKTSRLYAIPDRPGDYNLSPIDEIRLKAQVTGAAINSEKNQFALITYGKIFLFGVQNGSINFRTPLACISIARKQTEAILFDSDNSLLFTNEQRGIYRIR
ncbi:MAG TPA: hypothetical protein VFM90_08360, partial [Cyclobacteriaceae bacterium]|nr:hypothetical protein [Cyclobacteriaceae bacterium]